MRQSLAARAKREAELRRSCKQKATSNGADADKDEAATAAWAHLAGV